MSSNSSKEIADLNRVIKEGEIKGDEGKGEAGLQEPEDDDKEAERVQEGEEGVGEEEEEEEEDGEIEQDCRGNNAKRSLKVRRCMKKKIEECMGNIGYMGIFKSWEY